MLTWWHEHSLKQNETKQQKKGTPTCVMWYKQQEDIKWTTTPISTNCFDMSVVVCCARGSWLFRVHVDFCEWLPRNWRGLWLLWAAQPAQGKPKTHPNVNENGPISGRTEWHAAQYSVISSIENSAFCKRTNRSVMKMSLSKCTIKHNTKSVKKNTTSAHQKAKCVKSKWFWLGIVAQKWYWYTEPGQW